MAQKKQYTLPKKSAAAPKAAPLRPVEIYFNAYAETHQHKTGKLVSLITSPIVIFSLTGLVWWLPFPHIAFLGAYQSNFNWASFFIAFSVYFYYKLTPVLSYIMLLVLFAFSYAATRLQQPVGGIALWLIFLSVFLIAALAQVLAYRLEKKKPVFYMGLKFLWIGPIWWLQQLLRKY